MLNNIILLEKLNYTYYVKIFIALLFETSEKSPQKLD